MISGQYISEIRLKREEVESFDRYPFCLPAVRPLEKIEFHPAVTFFIGENRTWPPKPTKDYSLRRNLPNMRPTRSCAVSLLFYNPRPVCTLSERHDVRSPRGGQAARRRSLRVLSFARLCDGSSGFPCRLPPKQPPDQRQPCADQQAGDDWE